jgi:hypothetical protein
MSAFRTVKRSLQYNSLSKVHATLTFIHIKQSIKESALNPDHKFVNYTDNNQGAQGRFRKYLVGICFILRQITVKKCAFIRQHAI